MASGQQQVTSDKEPAEGEAVRFMHGCDSEEDAGI